MGATLFGGLPVVYICENNMYGMSVPFHARSFSRKCLAFDIRPPSERCTSHRYLIVMYPSFTIAAGKFAAPS